ncbi:MAG TPA: S8 family serine peptidase [Phycisphaerales bacterium]|nr:S8 family serine peptidase [Phycisphaerales bacterium]HMP37356.1 S8 family serine peptidase [Phycisphaerales bacterium]
MRHEPNSLRRPGHLREVRGSGALVAPRRRLRATTAPGRGIAGAIAAASILAVGGVAAPATEIERRSADLSAPLATTADGGCCEADRRAAAEPSLLGGIGGAPATDRRDPGDASHRPLVSSRILAHRRLKAEAALRPAAERRAVLEQLGLGAGDLDSERVAIYVRNRLDEGDIDALAQEGVRVVRGLFVPPVPGRHPLGFHLAQLEYAAIDRINGDSRVVRVESTEHALAPEHDVALGIVGIAAAHAGAEIGPYLGDGVTVVVADSGIDPTHPDLPVPMVAYDVTTGDWEDSWSTDVANTVIWHGTHVTGTVVGSGLLSGGAYRGGAPGANLVVHKIGNDVNGNSTFADMIKSVMHAAAIGADVYTVSYGGYETFLDGSSPLAQAFDAAFEMGTLCFTSAGNSAQRRRHRSSAIAPGASATFTMNVANSGDQPYTLPIGLSVIWREDGDPEDLNIEIECLTLGDDEAFETLFAGTSPRATEATYSLLWPQVPPASTRQYSLRLTNSAASGAAPLVHVYQASTSVATFPVHDPFFTVGTPAEADTVLAVGAWVHRNQWIDFTGSVRTSAQALDALASFSSRGPRIDGLLKPDIVAPGSMTISLRDALFATAISSTISNDGINDGSGPADYYVAQGTSMASPLAAAAAVLLREARPGLATPALRERIISTASAAAAPTMLVGHGMIDLVAALAIAVADLDGDGVVGGTDLGLLIAAWGECAASDCPADLDGDGFVGASDLALLIAEWG